jgi:hypothetical protein
MSISHHIKWDGVLDGDGKALNKVSGLSYNDNHDITPFAISEILTGIYHTEITIYSGVTSILISHNLGAIPDAYSVAPIGYCGVMWYITDESTTQCRFNLTAPQESDLVFKFKAEIL